MVFNLIPLPPLDGTSLMELILSGEALAKYRELIYHPGLRTFGILIAWSVMKWLFPPIHLAAINLLYLGTGVYWG